MALIRGCEHQRNIGMVVAVAMAISAPQHHGPKDCSTEGSCQLLAHAVVSAPAYPCRLAGALDARTGAKLRISPCPQPALDTADSSLLSTTLQLLSTTCTLSQHRNALKRPPCIPLAFHASHTLPPNAPKRLSSHSRRFFLRCPASISAPLLGPASVVAPCCALRASSASLVVS